MDREQWQDLDCGLDVRGCGTRVIVRVDRSSGHSILRGRLGSGIDIVEGRVFMESDLKTCDATYYFVLDFMGMTPDEYIAEKIINCESDLETLWNGNIERIKSVDISRLRLMAFHVIGSLDECHEIKESGLMNLQIVLSEETALKRLLEKAGVKFDILIKPVSCDEKSYDIDYEKYKGQHFLIGINEKLDRVFHRIYYDFCVNGFMANDNVFNYGTNIYERSEFLMTLGELFPQAEKAENF